MIENQNGSRLYEIGWSYEPRVTSEHLGRSKYSSISQALGELVTNAFDAEATWVDINFNINELGGVDAVIVIDNGDGISPATLEKRFSVVGVAPSLGQLKQFGRFGVGRFGVYRIGGYSKWTTTSCFQGKKLELQFELRSEHQGRKFQVAEKEVDSKTPTGTMIEIRNLVDANKDALNFRRIHNELLGQFCSYLLSNSDKSIRVQGEDLDVHALILRRDEESIEEAGELPDAHIKHLVLNRPIDRTRFPAQVIFSANGRTVATAKPDVLAEGDYLGIVECPYLDSILTSNREAILEMDVKFNTLQIEVLERVEKYTYSLRDERKLRFIESARRQEYYPYNGPPTNAITRVEQTIYDVVLEKINDRISIESMSKRQQEVMFKLLRRSLDNENIVVILDEVAKLTNEETEKFRKVLEYTTLNSIIKLSSEVTARLTFLDMLHEVVYGEMSKTLRERSQLHKILEPNCWIFGDKFHLAASDKGFREIIRRHRSEAELADIDEDALRGVAAYNDIPDIFLAASRNFPIHPKHHHVLVEIKAPKVPIGRKEVNQIRRYAETIENSKEFDNTSVQWDLFVISSEASPEIERDRTQKQYPFGCLWEFDNMNVWAFQWSEIIERARDEMRMVNEHLEKKSQELTTQDYLCEQFPEIFPNK